MDMTEAGTGIAPHMAFLKRMLDVVVSLIGLVLCWWLILVAALVAYFETGMSGIFTQKRVGRLGKLFTIYKIRTMKPVRDVETSVTTSSDERITKSGRFFRKTKIDELPQLINVLIGDMSLVGPRPDVPGFADKLQGKERIILQVRPGITGPATLLYRNEEELLATVDDPDKYNREVIYPDKVRINMEYVSNYSLRNDLLYLVKSVIGK